MSAEIAVNEGDWKNAPWTVSVRNGADMAWAWTGGSYRWLRAASGGKGTPDEIAAAKKFDGYLERGKYDGRMYRGIMLFDEGDYDVYRPGMVIDQRGTSSWTSLEHVAQGFSAGFDEVYRVLFVMDGTRKGRDISGHSTIQSEREIAVSSRSRQEITKVEQKGAIKYVYVREL